MIPIKKDNKKGVSASSNFVDELLRQFYLLMPSYEIWKSRFPNLTGTHNELKRNEGDNPTIRIRYEAK